MSLPDLDERFGGLVLELRATQVSAPETLRERVRALEDAPSAPRPRRRRLALYAVLAAALLATGAAVGGGIATPGGGRDAPDPGTFALAPATKLALLFPPPLSAA